MGGTTAGAGGTGGTGTGTGPCAGRCANPIVFTLGVSDYNTGDLGTGATCHETTETLTMVQCGNFVSPRSLTVNGTPVDCIGGGISFLPPKQGGGYCFQVSAGLQAWAYWVVWFEEP
jgi:hypothetical protein